MKRTRRRKRRDRIRANRLRRADVRGLAREAARMLAKPAVLSAKAFHYKIVIDGKDFELALPDGSPLEMTTKRIAEAINAEQDAAVVASATRGGVVTFGPVKLTSRVAARKGDDEFWDWCREVFEK